MTERLYRSERNKMIGGVCGGLAEYLQTDISLIRIIAVLTLFAGPGFFAYLIMWAVIPVNPAQQAGYAGRYSTPGEERIHTEEPRAWEEEPAERQTPEEKARKSKIAGLILIILGVVFLLDRWFPVWFDFDKLWPLFLIAFGIIFVWRGMKK